MNATAHSEAVLTVDMNLAGDVQGQGIRPTIARIANSLQLQGFVRNSQQGVDIRVTGRPLAIRQFEHHIARQFPDATLVRKPQSAICTVISQTLVCNSLGGFEILESALDGVAQCVLPVDRVICKNCLTECFTPGDRRFRYALNSCTQCGPRYSILHTMPYDRARTSMGHYSMCDLCRSEYADPSNRRYHAQANCCPACGPQIWFEKLGERIESAQAIVAASEAICDGKILALKGIGGYQLVCDAGNETAVRQLRQRKGRHAKPLAVMVESLTVAEHFAKIDATERAALESSAGPIVILQANAASPLAKNIHPGHNQIGLMLPTSALHALLLAQAKRPLVMTSGNCDGEPLEYVESQARRRFGELADVFLHHDRPIVRPIDDSVVRCMAGQVATIRAARGITPLMLAPSPQKDDMAQVFALSGHQKTAVAVSNGQAACLGPHLGNLETLRSQQRFDEQAFSLQSLMRACPRYVVRDLHPDFYTTQVAATMWGKDEVHSTRIIGVQHHHAHVVAAMVEKGWLERDVLGFAFDGTGLGTDGTIWGGEVLRASISDFQRVAHLRPFQLIGGEAAVREPWRVAVALLIQAMGERDVLERFSRLLADQWGVKADHLRMVAKLLRVEAVAVPTTSMGRMFDAVAAIACAHSRNGFEGEAAIRMESTCDLECHESYSISCTDSMPIELDWRPMIVEILSDWQAGLATGCIAMKFHRGVANSISQVAKRFPDLPIVLTGGVFQNRILVELSQEVLAAHPSPIAFPGRIPVNDGGLAAGQLAIALARSQRRVSCA